MKINIQIKSIFGKLLFEFEKEDNTIKETVLEAIEQSADLQYANLRSADLRSADLRSADLQSADLRCADLQYANLRSADLRYADLRYADLQSADLQYANLRSADLRYADLQYADLRSADLRYADIKKLITQTTILPEGDLIVWKKLSGGLLAQLLIPVKAKRVNAAGYRKCRFEFAKVIAIYDGKKKVKEGVSKQYNNFIYRVGEIVKPGSFDPSPLIECSNGINAFITKQEAIDY
jgi:hypothetical protein